MAKPKKIELIEGVVTFITSTGARIQIQLVDKLYQNKDKLAYCNSEDIFIDADFFLKSDLRVVEFAILHESKHLEINDFSFNKEIERGSELILRNLKMKSLMAALRYVAVILVFSGIAIYFVDFTFEMLCVAFFGVLVIFKKAYHILNLGLYGGASQLKVRKSIAIEALCDALAVKATNDVNASLDGRAFVLNQILDMTNEGNVQREVLFKHYMKNI